MVRKGRRRAGAIHRTTDVAWWPITKFTICLAKHGDCKRRTPIAPFWRWAFFCHDSWQSFSVASVDPVSKHDRTR